MKVLIYILFIFFTLTSHGNDLVKSYRLDKKFEAIFDQKPKINLEKMKQSPEDYRNYLLMLEEEDMEESDLLFEWSQSYSSLVEEYKYRTDCSPNSGVHTENECIALFVYTTQYFYMVNTVLRFGSEKDLQKIQPITEMISSALSKLPSYRGTVYRGIRRSQNVLSTYQKGKTVTAKAFVSTTSDTQSEYLMKEIKMIIKSKTGKDISRLGGHQGEKEILFDKGSTFYVSDRYVQSGQVVIEMTEK